MHCNKHLHAARGLDLVGTYVPSIRNNRIDAPDMESPIIHSDPETPRG